MDQNEKTFPCEYLYVAPLGYSQFRTSAFVFFWRAMVFLEGMGVFSFFFFFIEFLYLHSMWFCSYDNGSLINKWETTHSNYFLYGSEVRYKLCDKSIINVPI